MSARLQMCFLMESKVQHLVNMKTKLPTEENKHGANLLQFSITAEDARQ